MVFSQAKLRSPEGDNTNIYDRTSSVSNMIDQLGWQNLET